MQTPKLFTTLPEYVATPDGMAVHGNGDLILACPNYASPELPGCLVRINAQRKIEKWVDVPAHPETGCARPMGIAFGPDGDIYICDNQGWSGAPELAFKGRILRLKITGSRIVRTTEVATGMEHPNGIRICGDYLYVTQSLMSKVADPSGLVMSCVYRFHIDDEQIKVTNTLADPNILATFLTHNPACQYGADGIEIDREGSLYVGNFGDGAVYKLTFNPDGSVKENYIWAQDQTQLQATDGMTTDAEGNIYVADFSANALACIDKNGNVTRIAQSPDSDGLNGELDQPGEPCFWNGLIVISCFDLVTGPDKVNTRHELPATMSQIMPVGQSI